MRQFIGVIIIEAPLPVVIAMAEFAVADPIRHPDLPKLAAISNRRPSQRPEVQRLPGPNHDIRLAEFPQHTVGNGMKRVTARAGS